MSGVSEGETHVAAMRLVCQALEDHEQQGIEIQWDVLQQMLDHMDAILQGIEDQRRDDAEQIQILKNERDAAHEKVSTVRDEVAAEILHLREKLTAAEAAVSLQRAGIERLQAFVGKVRAHFNPEWSEDDRSDILSAVSVLFEALAELDAGTTEPVIDGDALAAGITEVVREIVEGRKAKAGGKSSVTLTGSPEPEVGQ